MSPSPVGRPEPGAGGPVIAGTRFTAVADRTGASGLRRSETGEPVVTGKRFQTEIDIAEASCPAVTGASGSVGVGKGFRPISGIVGAGGPAETGAGGPVVAGTRFLAVADVYAPFEETEGDPQSDIRKLDQISETITEVTSSHPLGQTGVTSVGVGKGFRPISGIAGDGGPAETGAGDPVVAGTRFLAVADVYAPFEETEGDPQSDIRKFDQISETITEVTSSHPLGQTGVTSVGVGKGFRPISGIAGPGGPAETGAGTRFLAVVDVYAPFEETEGDPQSDIRKFDQISETITEVTSSHPLGHTGVTRGTVVSKASRRTISESGAHDTDPDAFRGTSDNEQVGFPSLNQSPNEEDKPLDANRMETRLWLACWGRRHPGSSRDGRTMLRWSS